MDHRGGQLGGVRGIDQQAVDARFDHATDAAQPRGDHWRATGHRFERRHAERLEQRGEDEKGGAAVIRRQGLAVDVTGDVAHEIAQTLLVDDRVHHLEHALLALFRLGRAAGDHEVDAGDRAADELESVKQKVVSLVRIDAAETQDIGCGQPGLALVLVGSQWLKQIDVDAGRDDVNVVGAIPVKLCDLLEL